jgi:addiction module RelE/StbE family toxin
VTRVRWTSHAAADLARIVERIRDDNPSAALRVARTIYKGVAELRAFPYRGRIGIAPDTRELVFAPWPYTVVYEIIEDDVQVLRIRHASQDWP